MLFPFGIRNRVAMMTTMMTKGVAIEAFLSSANLFCHSNPLSSARVVFFTSQGKDKIDDKCFAMRCETGNGVNNNGTVSEAMNKNATIFVYVLPNVTTAWHMGGSSNQRAERRDEKDDRVITKFRSHKDQWMKETCYEWPSKCSTKCCTNKPTVGAHVVIDGKENVHLVPLCSRCNSDFSKNWVPDIEDNGEMQSSNGFQLETGTPCLELNHISREESVTSNNPFSWIEMYNLLLQYKHKNGDCNVPQRYEEHGVNLGNWLDKQRQAKKNNRLDTEKEKQLEDLGVAWEPLIDQWEENYRLLQQYKHTNGNCSVPHRYKENGVNLGSWLDTQRQYKKKNKLEIEKENRLEDLGVTWEPRIDQWEENFRLLEQYKQTNGDCNVPQQHEDNEQNLGSWLSTQRQNRKNNRLDAEKEKQLEDLGVIWEPLIDQWEENYKLLQHYKDINGNCNIPYQYKVKDVNLGWWLTTQRQEKRKNNILNAEKEKRLDDLGVIWEPQNDQWEEKYQILEQFKNERGHCNVSRGQKEDKKYRALGQWLNRQRSYYRKGNLENERQMKLDKLGVEWNLKTKKRKEWEEEYELLEQFKNERGHCNVSRGQKEDRKYRALGRWLNNQRSFYRKGNLRTERQMKLDKLGVEWSLKRKRKE